MYSDHGIVASAYEYCDVRLWDVSTGNIIMGIQ